MYEGKAGGGGGGGGEGVGCLDQILSARNTTNTCCQILLNRLNSIHTFLINSWEHFAFHIG